MNSNEEYLDSLLKAVTSGQGLDTGTEVDNKKPENDIENEFILDAPEWDDDDESADVIGDLSLDVDGLDLGDDAAGDGQKAGSSEDGADLTEEAAFLDPGALFFEGEEETEDDLFLNDTVDGDAPIMEEEAEDMGDPFFAKEESDVEDSKEDVGDENAGIGESSFDDSGSDTGENPVDRIDGAAEGEIGLQDDGDIESKDMEAMESMDAVAGADNDAVGEEELEDLILAADSAEEVMEEEIGELGNDDEGFQEISDLLANPGGSDEEMLAMLGGVEVEEEAADIGLFEDESKENNGEEIEETPEENKGKKKKAKKGKKGKKAEADAKEADAAEENEAGSEENPKKQGVFARFMNFLLEEDEEESSDGEDQEANIDELLMGETADENAAILAELDEEKESKKSGKKEKKKKGKKGKEKEASDDGEEGEEDSGGEKSKKAKKEKKKKEKKVKEEPVPEEPGKKLSAKKIRATALLCFSIAAAIILIVQLIPPALDKGKARDAYYAKDYAGVVEGFYGEKLSESDELMYDRAMTILKFQRKIDAYNSYMYMGKETEALNQLIEAINRYDEVYEEAVAYNVIGEIDTLYQTVLDALQNRYGLSISRAMEIYAIEDDFEYTLMLESVISGIEYKMPETAEENPEGEAETPEEQLPEGESDTPLEQLPEGESDTSGEQLSEGEAGTPEEQPAPEEVPAE